jgi:hypothetical protein
VFPEKFLVICEFIFFAKCTNMGNSNFILMGFVKLLWYSLVRFRIRRAYNSQSWNKSISLALTSENCPKNANFARDIILRSLWNLNSYQEVVDYCQRHDELRDSVYLLRADSKLKIESHVGQKIPESFSKITYNFDEPISNWYQDGSFLWFCHPHGWVHWEMPQAFSLEETHDALLELASEVLLAPFVPKTRKIMTKKRTFGNHTALSYSGGIDSTAAAILLPDDVILGYHYRSFPSNIRHHLAQKTFDKWQKEYRREVLIFPSNQEEIRTFYGKNVGFSTDYASGVHFILLADHLDLRSICFGTVLENTWLEKGVKYRNFAESWHWLYWKKRFLHAGLELELPINHLTEAVTLKICSQHPLHNTINSCSRGIKQGCGECWKCFHKNGPLGRRINPRSKEITIKLAEKPLRSGFHAIWALKTQRLGYLAPQYDSVLNQDLIWWEQAYAPGLSIISETMREHIRLQTETYVTFMKHPRLLRDVNLHDD